MHVYRDGSMLLIACADHTALGAQILRAAMALAVEQLAADRSRLVAALGGTEDWTILAASHKAGVICTVHVTHAAASVSGTPEEEGLL